MPLYVGVEILQAISALATNANTNEMCYLSRELQLLVLTTGTGVLVLAGASSGHLHSLEL